ncbi:glycosyltransferase family 9 protein [Nannocystis pusilla]|uniref:glycosyltransferase family 9 protein n=1 Tax=Nannocystis pusilla TaxID=889268 RepID=UPI003DA27896
MSPCLHATTCSPTSPRSPSIPGRGSAATTRGSPRRAPPRLSIARVPSTGRACGGSSSSGSTTSATSSSPARPCARSRLISRTSTSPCSPAPAAPRRPPCCRGSTTFEPCRALWQDLGRLAFDPARERELIATLRRGEYDLALILTSFSQTPHPAALACALAGIPMRVGESRERGRALTLALPHADDGLHQCERNLQLVERLGVPVVDRRLEIRLPRPAWSAAQARLAAHGVAGDYLVWNPFASCAARTYDPLRHALAARALAEYADLRLVVCGAARDRERARELLPLLGPRGLDLVGETDLPEFAALLAGARLVLTNNTAALHLADALAVPQLVTYAGTDRDSQWRPRTSPHRLLRRPTACTPCYRFACPTGHECLALAPAEVLAAGLSLLAETAVRT